MGRHPTPVKDRAEELIRELLASGPRRANEMARIADIKGIHPYTFRIVARRMGVTMKKHGTGRGSWTEWSL